VDVGLLPELGMNFYVAASHQGRAKIVARCLELAGHKVIARWLGEPFCRTRYLSEESRMLVAKMCADDIAEADALVLLSDDARTPGGKFIEAGIALGQGKRVFVIGWRENCLLWHPDCFQFESVSHLIATIDSTYD
jgi:hypothetical protein